jgi:hypothetical protein
MAKVKKMAFGGMGSGIAAGMGASRPPMAGNQPPAGANLMQKFNGPPSAPPQSRMQQMQQMQPRGALGGNQAPAGANLLKSYNGPQAAMPDYAKPYVAQSGQPTAPPAFKSSFGGLGMKKGGAVKSASARGDGIAKRGKTRGKIV